MFPEFNFRVVFFTGKCTARISWGYEFNQTLARSVFALPPWISHTTMLHIRKPALDQSERR